LRYLPSALADRQEKYMLYKEILSQCPELKFQRINEKNNDNTSLAILSISSFAKP